MYQLDAKKFTMILSHKWPLQPIYKNSWRWTCKCPKHVEAIYGIKS